MAMGLWQVTGDNKVTCHTYFTGQRGSLYFVINMAIAGNLHVDLIEVMRVTITHNPLFLSDPLRGRMGKSGHLAMAV